MNRRSFLKLAGIGVGALTIPFLKRKKDNMTIAINGFSNSDYSAGVTSIEFDSSVRVGLAGQYPGLVVGVAIFEPGEVTSVLWQGLNLTRVDNVSQNGNYRSEMWYLANAPTADDVVTVNLSQSTTVKAGAAVYQYFGGVGFNVEAIGTGTQATINIDPATYPLQNNSILFSHLCVAADSGWSCDSELNSRWGTGGGGALGSGLSCDVGPISPPEYTEITFHGGSADFAMNLVELLDYQSDPSAIIGSAM